MAPLPLLILIALASDASQPPAQAEVTAVVAVAEPPLGPTPDLAELAHQLRGACRDRVSGVQEVPEMRARLLGDRGGATVPELERAYVGAQAAFQADELDSALRTLHAIAGDLERLPEGPEAYALWLRTQLRIALAERTSRRPAAVAAAVERIVALEPGLVVDAQQYSPSFRREFDELRRRALQRPRSQLTITSNGGPATAFVDGKAVGVTPVTVSLPAGGYRVGGALGRLRAPAARVVLDGNDARVELDTALAGAVRADAGPGLALGAGERAAAIVRAGAWLGADRVVAASVVSEGEVRYLSGAAYDVRRGALLREGRVRMATGSVSAAHVGALASFLLTGQAVQGVTAVAPAATAATAAGSGSPAGAGPLVLRPAPGASAEARGDPPSRPRWMRPAAYASGALALGLAGLATQQALSSRDGYREASALLRPDGALVAGADRARYDQVVADAGAARRNAYLAAGGTVVFAALAGVLGYLSWDERGEVGVRF